MLRWVDSHIGCYRRRISIRMLVVSNPLPKSRFKTNFRGQGFRILTSRAKTSKKKRAADRAD